MTDATAIRLIVNADELGLTPEVTEGILKAHHEGIVTSASIMGNLANPAALARELAGAPALGLGAHLVLVGGTPVSAPRDIPHLIEGTGQLPDSPAQLALRWLRGKLPEAELETELLAQAERLRAAGMPLDHLDTYLHLGFLPPVARVVERVAAQLRIRAIRSSMEVPNLTWFADLQRGLPLAALGAFGYLARKKLGALRHGAESWGFAESGNLGRMRIMEILGRLGPGVHELICHPGTTPQDGLTLAGHRVLERRLELEALCDPKIRQAVARRGITLCRFGDVF